jgi:hypothetical protein
MKVVMDVPGERDTQFYVEHESDGDRGKETGEEDADEETGEEDADEETGEEGWVIVDRDECIYVASEASAASEEEESGDDLDDWVVWTGSLNRREYLANNTTTDIGFAGTAGCLVRGLDRALEPTMNYPFDHVDGGYHASGDEEEDVLPRRKKKKKKRKRQHVEPEAPAVEEQEQDVLPWCAICKHSDDPQRAMAGNWKPCFGEKRCGRCGKWWYNKGYERPADTWPRNVKRR